MTIVKGSHIRRLSKVKIRKGRRRWPNYNRSFKKPRQNLK